MTTRNRWAVFTSGILWALTVLALLSFSPRLANANTITIDSIIGTWGNVTGTTATGEGTNVISWGGGTAQSSYEFNAQGVPFDVAASPFLLGDFVHANWPISPPSITGADLTVTVGGNVAGEVFSIGGTYRFSHFETPNSANPCAAGGTQPCPDLVEIVGALSFDDSVIVDGEEYFLDLFGFQTGTTFLTAEGASNTTQLFGAFTTEPVIDVTPVPLPAGMMLLLTGFGGLAGLRLMRRGRTTP